MIIIVFDTFIFILKWPNNRWGKWDYMKRWKSSIYSDIIINHMLECPFLSQLDSLSLFFLCSTFPFLPLSLPFRNWHCVRAQISPHIQPSGWHKVSEDDYNIWPSKETFRWWCLIFLVGGGKSFSPSVLCSNPLQVLETHWLCQHMYIFSSGIYSESYCKKR